MAEVAQQMCKTIEAMRPPVATRGGSASVLRMKIATWNINGVKARIDTALAWLKEASPDIACLQEIKSVD